MNRNIRKLAVSTMIMLALAIVAACGGSDSAAPEQETGPVTLQVLTFNDYIPEDLAAEFKKKTGNDLEISYITSNEDGIAKITAAAPGTYDIVFLTSPFTQGLITAGKVEPLDASKIPNLANLYPEATEVAYDPGNAHSIPYSWGTTGICYREDLVGDTVIDSWADLLTPDEALKGKITMLDEDRWLLEPALKLLGFSLNTTDPAELQQAVDLSIAAKATLLGYDAETFYSKLVSGEAVAVQGWDGWCNYGTAEDPRIKFVIPKEGSDLWVDTLVIPKGSTRMEATHQFMNFILEPQNGQWVAENILYKVPNKGAMDALDPALLEQFPNMAIPPNLLLQQEALEDLGEGQAAFTEAASKVKAG